MSKSFLSLWWEKSKILLIVNYPSGFDPNVSAVVDSVVLFRYLLVTLLLIDKEWQVWRFSPDIRRMLKCSMSTFHFILTQMYFIWAVSLAPSGWILTLLVSISNLDLTSRREYSDIMGLLITRHLVRNLTDVGPAAMDNLDNIRTRNMFACSLQISRQSQVTTSLRYGTRKSQQISQQLSIKLCFDLKRIESTDLQFHVAKICKETPKYLCPIHFKVDFIAALNISDHQRKQNTTLNCLVSYVVDMYFSISRRMLPCSE